MPKVRHFTQQYDLSLLPDTRVPPAIVLNVGWGRDSVTGIELVTQPDVGGEAYGRITDYLSKTLATAGMPPVDWHNLAHKVVNIDQGLNGFYLYLTERRDVNSLIHTLRRARDQVFGRDE